MRGRSQRRGPPGEVPAVAVARPFGVGIFGDNSGRMLDTHAVARSLTDAEFTPAQADAITNAVRLAAEHGDHVTSDQLKVGLAGSGNMKRDPVAT